MSLSGSQKSSRFEESRRKPQLSSYRGIGYWETGQRSSFILSEHGIGSQPSYQNQENMKRIEVPGLQASVSACIPALSFGAVPVHREWNR